jgi:hypothetical protein
VPHLSLPFRLRSALTSIAALLLAALATRALAAEHQNPLVALPRQVHAGQQIELEWRGLPREVEELEILLSVDDGRTFPIRVSPELEAREGRYLWRVPNLAAAAARLRVRANLDGEESEYEPTEPFAILARNDAALELDLVHEGIWWRGLAARRSAAPSDLYDESRPGLAETRAPREFAPAPRVAGERPMLVPETTPIPASREAHQPAQPARDAKPSFVPARK